MKDFKGKVAVITGAASGIGRGLAEHCAKEGMKVVLADIEDARLKDTEKALKSDGADVLAIKTDVSKLQDVEALAQKTIDIFGGVHLLFNNAGVSPGSNIGRPLWENTFSDWEWVLGVNLWGVIYGINVFTPIMLKQNTGCHIVNTASMAGLITEQELVIYAVTKAGVIKLSEGLYLQLKRRNPPVGVSVLCPAFVSSDLDNAERNRPEEFQNPPEVPRERERPSLQKNIEESGLTVLSPEQCAEVVFEAIRDDMFYILTDRLIDRLMEQRIDNILQRRNPEAARIIQK
jgi:NAD(P)-dependent dehydrogenase (short-subunit alcohol dehydrogenase family)